LNLNVSKKHRGFCWITSIRNPHTSQQNSNLAAGASARSSGSKKHEPLKLGSSSQPSCVRQDINHAMSSVLLESHESKNTIAFGVGEYLISSYFQQDSNLAAPSLTLID
jgi:hypothetical protein